MNIFAKTRIPRGWQFSLVLLIGLFFALSLFASTLRVSIKAHHIPLRQVLNQLSHQYSLAILFADELVEGIRVDCDINNLPLEEALVQILQNTRLSFKIVKNGQVVLYDSRKIRFFTIRGRVQDCLSGEMLPNANVQILGTTRGTQTNREGRFVLIHVPLRVCSLRVSYLGYRPDTLLVNPVNLQPDLLVTLQPIAFLSDSVVVHANNYQFFATQAEAGHYSISPTQFSDLPIIGDKDIFRSLQLLPGISTNLNGTSGVNIRGSSPSENLLLLDGMTLYHADHSFGLLSSVSSDVIKDVQLYKSGYPAEYGGRLAGVLDITTKSGDLDQFHATLNLNRLCGQSTLEIPLWGRGSLLLSGRASYSRYLMEDLYRKLVYRPPYQPDAPPLAYYELVSTDSFPGKPGQRILGTIGQKIRGPYLPEPTVRPDIHFYDLFSKLTLLSSSHDVLVISTLISKDAAITHDDRDSLSYHSDNEWNSWGSSVRWFRQWGNRLESQFLISNSEYVKDFRQFQQFRFPGSIGGDTTFTYRDQIVNRINNFSLKWHHSFHINSASDLGFGLDYNKSRVSFNENSTVLANKEASLSQSNQAREFAGYAQFTWHKWTKLNTILGYRGTYYFPLKKLHHDPRFHFQFRMHPNFLIKGSWGISHQFTMKIGENDQNTATSVFWVLANDTSLKPAYSDQKTIGLQWKKKNVLVDLEYFYNNLYNLPEVFIYYDESLVGQNNNDGLVWQIVQKNFSVHGVDLLLKKQSGNPGFWVSYGFLHKKYRPRGEYLQIAGEVLPELTHTFKLVGNYRMKRLNIVLSYQYATGKYYTRPTLQLVLSRDLGSAIFNQYYVLPPFVRNQHRLPATSQVDLSINYRFRWENLACKLSFMVFNLLDSRNIWYKYYYPDGDRLKHQDIYMFGFTPSLSLEMKWN